jgi:hypothetical protein
MLLSLRARMHMGFLSGLFGSKAVESLEDRLLREYADSFLAVGADHSEARKTAQSVLDGARQLVQERGWSDEAPGRGDHLLEVMETKPTVRAEIEKIRSEGVRDEDIRTWWNLPPLERAAIEKMDELNRSATWLGFLRQGKSFDEAAAKMWKAYPKFGDASSESGDDRPLPIELKFRIVQYIEKQVSKPNAYKKRLKAFASFNALIRHEIREGNL